MYRWHQSEPEKPYPKIDNLIPSSCSSSSPIHFPPHTHKNFTITPTTQKSTLHSTLSSIPILTCTLQQWLPPLVSFTTTLSTPPPDPLLPLARWRQSSRRSYSSAVPKSSSSSSSPLWRRMAVLCLAAWLSLSSSVLPLLALRFLPLMLPMEKLVL